MQLIIYLFWKWKTNEQNKQKLWQIQTDVNSASTVNHNYVRDYSCFYTFNVVNVIMEWGLSAQYSAIFQLIFLFIIYQHGETSQARKSMIP